MTTTEKYNNTVELFGKEVADQMLTRQQTIEAEILRRYGKKYKYKTCLIESNQSIRDGKLGDFYLIKTAKGTFKMELKPKQ